MAYMDPMGKWIVMSSLAVAKWKGAISTSGPRYEPKNLSANGLQPEKLLNWSLSFGSSLEFCFLYPMVSLYMANCPQNVGFAQGAYINQYMGFCAIYF